MSALCASLSAFFAASALIPFTEAAGPAAKAGPSPADIENDKLSSYLMWAWAAVVGPFIIYQIAIHLSRYVRTIACLGNDTQRYFASPNVTYGRFKRYLLDAPLFRTRHHREYKLSSAINVGTLPSRLQMLFISGYLAMNVVYCVIWIPWSSPEKKVLPELRNRIGALAVVNMLPLVLLASRNNPLINLCGISFDTFNLMHRWFGRIVVLEGVAHATIHIVNKVHTVSWAAFVASLKNSEFIRAGFIAVVALLFLLLHSPSPLRHAFYETFLHMHIAVVALAIAMIWVHLRGRSQLLLLYGVVAIWAAERAIRLALTIIRNVGSGGTKVEVEALPGDCVRMTINMARPWKFQPGQHAFITVPSVGLWTNHPFSVAWSEEEEDFASEKGLPVSRQDVLENRKTNMCMVVRRRTGFTDRLFQRANSSPSGKFTTTAFVEGPYGGGSLTSYGTVQLWAAGIGIAHQVSYVRDIVAGFENGTTATRRLSLVWIIQSPEHLEWIRPWMTAILSMPRRREILKILLFVTRPRSTKEVHSPSSSVQMYPGKPNIQALVDQEMHEGIGAACVSVCGTGSLADDVRRAVRKRQTVWNVDFREEAFSW